MKRDFKGVWFPSELWLEKSLSPLHKMFLLECDSLNNPKTGCYASNAHFSEMFGVTKGRCSQIIKDLERGGWVTIKLTYDGKEIKKRTIRVVNALNRGSKYIKSPYLENAQGSNNNKAVTTKDYMPLIDFDEFWPFYPKKVAKEAARKAWNKLNAEDRQLAFHDIPTRFSNQEDKQFILNPATYLNGRRWEDERIEQPQTGAQILINNLRENDERSRSIENNRQPITGNECHMGKQAISASTGQIADNKEALGKDTSPFYT